MTTAILSLDIGTSHSTAVLFDLAGRELAAAEQAHRLHTPQPGWVELAPDEIWGALIEAVKAVCLGQASGVDILAVALSTQGGSLIPMGADGRPTYNAITWLDRRSESVVARWRQDGLDQHIRQISGWEPQPGLPLPSICALRQSQPAIFSATRRFLSVNDYVVYRLTGRFVTNPSMAGEMLLTDIRTGQWERELCGLAGIEAGQLSPILPSEAVCGEIAPEVCRQTGLPKGTLLVNGGQDHSCEALALGMVLPGNYWLACGTAWVINGVTDSPRVDAVPAEMALNHHVVPQRWIASQFLGGLGAGMEWWLDQFWQSPPSEKQIPKSQRYASFNAALKQTQPGSSGLLFYPVSGRPGSGAASGGYWGLRLDHTRADMGRAVMEGAAHEVRWAVDAWRVRNFGLPVEKLWMVGGAARSPLWPQIVADVVGIPMTLAQYSHGPALGAALLAARGLGWLKEFPVWVTAQPVEPNLANAPLYEERHAAYRQMVERYRP